MRILYNNNIDSDTLLTVSSENSNYPKRFSYSVLRSEKFKFTGNTSEYIILDLGSAIANDCIGLSSNLTSSATLTVEFNSTNSWGAPAESESITTTGQTVIHQTFTSHSYRYVRITFADATNTEDITIDYISIGEYLQTPGIKSGYETGKQSTSVTNISTSGQPYSKIGYKYKTHKFNFIQMTSAKRAEMETFFDTVDTVTPFFMSIVYNDRTTIIPEFCRLTNIKQNKQDKGLFFDGSMSTRESF